MKRIYLLIFILISVSAGAQTLPGYFAPISSPYDYQWLRARYLRLPPSTVTVSNPDTGAVRFNKTTLKAEVYTGLSWTAIGGSSYTFTGPLSESAGTVSISQAGPSTAGYLSAADYQRFFAKTDSIKVRNDSLFEYKNGTEYARGKISATIDSFLYATRRYVDSSTTVFGSRLYDTYNTHDTLTQSRLIDLNDAYGLTFTVDGTNDIATGINASGFTTKRSKHDFTANNGWIYGQLHDPAQVYKTRFQVIGLVNDSTHSAQLISTNGNTYNQKAALVSAGWSDGVKLQTNVNWTTSGSTSGYKGIYVYSTAGDGTGQVKIDREVLSVGSSTDSALVRKSDGTIGLYPVGSGGGGASSTTALTDVSDAAPANNSTLVYNEDSAKYIPTPVIRYDLTGVVNGDVLQVQISGGDTTVVPYTLPSGGSGDTIYYAATTPTEKKKNGWFNTQNHHFYVLNDEGTHYIGYGPADSVAIGTSGGGGGTYDADVEAYLTRHAAAGGTMSTADKDALNTAIVTLKDSGLYTKVSEIYFLKGGTAATHALAFKSAAKNLTWNDEPLGLVHSATGTKGDGTGTGTIPFAGTDFGTSGHLFAYSRTATAGANDYEIGCSVSDATGFTYMAIRTANLYGAISGPSADNENVTASTASTQGYFMINKLSNTVKGYRNGADLGGTTASYGDVQYSGNLALLGNNQGGLYNNKSQKELGFVSLSVDSGMTDAEAATYYNIISTLMTAWGR